MSNKAARKHYSDTIEKPVQIDIIKKFVDPVIFHKIQDLYPDGNVYVWGVTNGSKNVNKHKWEKMKQGDVTLFSKDGILFRTAVTTISFTNKALAEELWQVNDVGETWENIYLVDEIQALNLTCKQLNKIVGYEEGSVVRGFNVLDDEKSNALFNKLDLYSETFSEAVSQEEYEHEIEKLINEDSLDKVSQSTSRKEQSYLRKKLFKGKKSAVCGICGKELPVDLLIAAHIKRRADCSKEERLDVDNIVMPMCKLGCDDLYEKGYILVQEGSVKKNYKKWMSPVVSEYINKLDSIKCESWTENNKNYFEHHNIRFN